MVLIYSHAWQIKSLGRKPIQIVTDNNLHLNLTAIGMLHIINIYFISATQQHKHGERLAVKIHLDTLIQRMLSLPILLFILGWNPLNIQLVL